MAITMSSLPDEILVEITRHLQTDSLKNARQVCNRWAKAGASRLFRRIYFAPRKDIMEIFKRITSEPAFAVGVTELVYDARLFWRFLAGKRAHRQIIAIARGEASKDKPESVQESQSASEISSEAICTGMISSIYDCSSFTTRAAKERSYNRYAELFEQQNDILDSGTDFLALCHGLNHLLNLKTVTIQSYFDSESDWVCLHDPLPPWYLTWSSNFCRHTLSPASYNDCVMARREFLELDYYNVANHNAVIDHPWDWRGVKNCLKALTMRRSSITHLHYGYQGSKLPIQILADSGVSKSLENIAPELHCLNLDANTAGGDTDGDSGFEFIDGYSEAIAVLAKTLKEARQLTTLSSSLSLYYHKNLYQTFGELASSKLTGLHLRHMEIDLAFLKSICQRHQRTLKVLKLRNMLLLRQDGFGENNSCTWDDVGRVLSPILQLSDLYLAAICEEFSRDEPTPFLTEDRIQALGYQLMSSVPRDLLKMCQGSDESSDFSVKMWHETETIHEDRRLAV